MKSVKKYQKYLKAQRDRRRREREAARRERRQRAAQPYVRAAVRDTQEARDEAVQRRNAALRQLQNAQRRADALLATNVELGRQLADARANDHGGAQSGARER